MSILRSTLIVGAATAASRILGFVRDVLIAQTLGAGLVADAFLAAFRLPNLIRRVLSEGGLNAGFVPLYARLKAEQGPEAGLRFAGETMGGLALVLVGVVAAVELAAGVLILGLAAGFADDPAALDLAAWYLRLMMPFVAGVTLASLAGALLNAEGRFAVASLAPLMLNFVLIAVLLVRPAGASLADPREAALLSLAVAVSGFLQLALVVVAIRRLPGGFRISRPRLSPDMRRLIRAAGPAFLASGSAQVIILAAAQVASFTPGVVSWFYYAERVFALPLGFVGSALGLVLLSELSHRHAGHDQEGLDSTKNRALEACLLVMMPAAVGLYLLADLIPAVLFVGGAFSLADSHETAAALAGLSIGLPLAVAGKVLSQGFFARGEGGRAALAVLFGAVTTITSCFLLPTALWGTLSGRIGIGATLGFAAHAGLLAVLLIATGKWRPDRRLISRAIRIVLASLFMGLVVQGFGAVLGGMGLPGSGELLRLVLLCLGGMGAYAAAALALGAVTRNDLAGLVARR